MLLHILHRTWLFFAIPFLAACLPILPETSTPESLVSPSVQLTSSIPPTRTHSPMPTPTPEMVIAPTPTATPFSELVTTTTPTVGSLMRTNALYQYTCSYDNCAYASWVKGADRDYVPKFQYLATDSKPEHSPAHALILTFANFSHQMAYWTDDKPGQLWISDLDYQHPQLIFSDDIGDYPVNNPPSLDYRLNLIWSPDDMHLIIDAPTNTAPDLIYHLQTKKLEEWPWECDRVAFSPHTERLATWCSSTIGQSQYAVMEWGEDIWYSEVSPTTELVRGIKLSPPKWIETLVQTWTWSADGQQIAYFDPIDPDGNLLIADVSGNQIRVLPSNIKDLGPFNFFSAEDLQWSQDGRHLRMYVYGSVEHPCPPSRNLSGEGPEMQERACWQILDTETGNVLWTPSNSAEKFMALVPHPLADIALWEFTNATISPEGNLVALVLSSGALYYGFIINVETGDIESIPAPVTAMRWSTQP